MFFPVMAIADMPNFVRIEAAAARLRGTAVRTPLHESAALNARCGGRVLLKLENLQRTGSFKFRGAYNRLAQLTALERKSGVVAYSSGNHAQAVAAAAAIVETEATILMPADAPLIKTERTKALGAEVVLHQRYRDDREAMGARLATEKGAVMVPPYEDSDVIAGQGTVGLELAAQARDLSASLDAVLICCGGGGLTAGCAIALRETTPETDIYTVEPADFDDTRRSLASGRREKVREGGVSFCDALLAPTPGALTFAINRELVTDGLAVTDAEVVQAMAFAFSTLRIVLEPGGAVTLAAVLTGKLDCRDKTVAIVCSGGNVDPDTFNRTIQPVLCSLPD